MRSTAGIVVWLCCALFAQSAFTQAYPSKPVRILVGSPAGSIADILARPIAQRLSEMLGQQVLVDNRAGATGIIANEIVARAQPDGYTLLVSPNSFLVVNPHLNRKLPYDVFRDFAPITQISVFHHVLVVHPSVPAKSVKELIALARSKPGAMIYASSGVGSGFHLAGEMFRSMARVDIVHVPFKGTPSVVIDVLAGRVDMTFIGLSLVQSHIKAGKLRAMAVTGLKRESLLPEVPTLDESGLRGFEIAGGHCVVAPAGTPREIIDRLNAAIVGILGTPEVRQLWSSLGMEVVTTTPEQLAVRLREDYAKYGRLIKAAGIKGE